VRCRIDTYGRGECPTYEALSYCWGSPDPITRICVSDANQEGVQHSVGDGLASALCHLRYSDKPRRIWIDALCIDQSNLDEKALQVASMDTTYKRCSQAVVWLGYASEAQFSTLGVEAINVIGGQSEGLSLRALGAPRPPLPTTIGGHPPKAYLPAIQRLLERPWFTRVWVCAIVRCSGSESLTAYRLYKSSVWLLGSSSCVALTPSRYRATKICSSVF